MDNKPNNVIRIPNKGISQFYLHWLKFLYPFHKLTEQEMVVGACFLQERQRLSKYISNDDLLDKALVSEDILNTIKDRCNIKNAHFQVLKARLKKKHFFIGDKVNPKMIPNIREKDNEFRLLLWFDIDRTEDEL